MIGRPIDSLNKGLGFIEAPVEQDGIARLGWNLLREDLSLPAAVLYEDRLKHNLAWMQEFIAAYGVQLAPHGKTTMAPRLFEMQLQGGAWGITLATAHQTQVAYTHGVRRVLMANQLVGNHPGAGALEVTAYGPTLTCLRPTFVAVVGASPDLQIDGQVVAHGRVVPVMPRQRVSVGAVRHGFRIVRWHLTERK